MEALGETIKKDAKDIVTFMKGMGIKQKGTEEEAEANESNKEEQGRWNKWFGSDEEEPVKTGESENKEEVDVSEGIILAIGDKFTELLKTPLITTILASTLAKYKWPSIRTWVSRSSNSKVEVPSHVTVTMSVGSETTSAVGQPMSSIE